MGPHAFLRAVRSVLEKAGAGRPFGATSVAPVDELPVFAAREEIRNLRFRDGWSIFPPDFEGRNVIEMIRRQTWTARPAATDTGSAGPRRG